MTSILLAATYLMTKIIFFGNERLVSGLKSTDAPLLKGLIERGYEICAVVSHHSDSHSRNDRALEVAEIAKQHDIPVLLPNRPTDIKDELIAMNAEVAVLEAYGRIIPQSIIDIFPKGIVNIHPSLLPNYRGPTPIESPIMNGDSQTGVSIMQLTSGMDSGPVYVQQSVELTGRETKFDLYEILAAKGAELLFDALPRILDGSLTAAPQDESRATYCKLLDKSDGLLDPSKLTAVEAERRIRAFLGFPKTKVTILNQSIIITKAHVSREQKTPLDIACQDGEYLSIDQIIGPSGKTMNAEAFLNGYAAS